MQQRVDAIVFKFGDKTGCAYCRDAKKAVNGDPQHLERLIAELHWLGYTIDIVPVDQLPEEIPGERIVINPLSHN